MENKLTILLSVVVFLFLIGFIIMIFSIFNGEIQSITSTTTISGGTPNPNIAEWTNFNKLTNGDTYYPEDFDISNMSLLWTFDFDTGGTDEINPISVYDGIVYAGAYQNKSLNAFNLSNGNLLWTYNVLPNNAVNFPTINVDDNLVYIIDEGTSEAMIYALNKNTGIQVWNYTFDARNDLTAPLIVGDVLYQKIQNGYNLFALDKTTGTQLWNKTYYKNNWAMPSYSNGKLFLTFEDDALILAVNSSNGDEIWNYSASVTWYGTPLVKNNMVYTGTYDSSIIALDENNGSLIWTFPVGSDCEGTPAEHNGILVWGCYDTYFYALNSSTGEHLWNFSLGTNFESTPVITKNNLVFFSTYSGSDSWYIANLTNGDLLWNSSIYITPADMDYVTPTLVNNVVIASNYDGVVYAIGDPTKVQLTPTITTVNSQAGEIAEDVNTAIATTIDWFPIIIVITAMVVLILLTIIIFNALRNNQLVGSA